MLPTDAGLRAELWLVLSTPLFEALVEGGKLDKGMLVVPPDLYEELDWPKVRAAFAEAGYDVEEMRCGP